MMRRKRLRKWLALSVLSAMLLARFMERGKRIKEDNDSII